MRFTIRVQGREALVIPLEQPLGILRDMSHSNPLTMFELVALDRVRAKAWNGAIVENNYEYPFSDETLVDATNALKQLEWRHISATLDEGYSAPSVLTRLDAIVSNEVDRLLPARVGVLASQLYLFEQVEKHHQDAGFVDIGKARCMFDYDNEVSTTARALLDARGYSSRLQANGDLALLTTNGAIIIPKPEDK